MDTKIRTCIITRKKGRQNEMMQIIYHPSWNVVINKKWQSWEKWRSVYLFDTEKNIEHLCKRWVMFLNRVLKNKVSNDEYDKLNESLRR